MKSFIKIKPVTSSSEKHNTRVIEPKYLIEKSNENIHIVDESIASMRLRIEENYKKNVGQKMQEKATPIREAVILLPNDDNDTNIEKLMNLNTELEQRYGIKAFQVHIHNDEGHTDKETGVNKYNYHAHVVYNWTNELGKSFKLGKDDLAEIQTITARHMEMERGIHGSKSLSLNHHDFRGYLQIKDQLEKEFKIKLSQEQEKQIRTQILEENERNKNNRANQRGISR